MEKSASEYINLGLRHCKKASHINPFFKHSPPCEISHHYTMSQGSVEVLGFASGL